MAARLYSPPGRGLGGSLRSGNSRRCRLRRESRVGASWGLSQADSKIIVITTARKRDSRVGGKFALGADLKGDNRELEQHLEIR